MKNKINGRMSLYFGINLFTGVFSFTGYRQLKKDLRELKRQAAQSKQKFPVTKLYACYKDKKGNAGTLNYQYFYQDLFVAQQISKNNPQRHIDIGSRMDGFIVHVASFRPIEVFDIRPIDLNIPNIIFKQADIMNYEGLEKECTDSISSLHVLEHFGLGRYGDPICFEGYLLGFKNITSLLKKGGKFYFSVPLGKQRIEFHAHRVFSLDYLLQLVSEDYTIDSFSYIDDNNRFFREINLSTLSDEEKKTSLGVHLGCAVFVLTKK